MGTCPKCGSRVKVLAEPREGVTLLVCLSVACDAPPYERPRERALFGSDHVYASLAGSPSVVITA